MDGDGGEEITAFCAFSLGEASVAHPELLIGFASGGDSQFDRPIEGGYGHFGTKYGFPWGEVELIEKVGSLGVEKGVGRVADSEVEIAWASATGARLALARNADALAVDHSDRNADVK